MYLIFKLVAFILIVHLKLNGLDAIPLIERHKSSLSALWLSVNADDEANGTGTGNRNQNIYYINKSMIAAKARHPKIIEMTTTEPSRTTVPITTKITMETVVKTINQTNSSENAPRINSTIGHKINGNHQSTPIDYKYIKINDNENKNSYYHYNIININNNNYDHDDDDDDVRQDVPSLNNNDDDYENSTLGDIIMKSSISESYDSYSKENPNHANYDERESDNHNNDDDDGDDSVNDNDNVNNYELGRILLNATSKADFDRFLLQYRNNVNENVCFLNNIKKQFLWWSNPDGSLYGDIIFNLTRRHGYLDLSFRNMSKDSILYKTTCSFILRNDYNITAFSAAKNNLTQVPYRTLKLMNTTLKYLTLKSNRFAGFMPDDKLYERHDDLFWGGPERFPKRKLSERIAAYRRKYRRQKRKLLEEADEGIAWATFPLMPALTELDLSDCRIEFVTKNAFKNLTSLKRLFMSHNKLLTIPHNTFIYTSSLKYLDLSYTNAVDSSYQMPSSKLDSIYNMIYGVKIQQSTFRHLPELVYLDLSHTKLTRSSAVAFTSLGDKLKYMSLCYTAFPVVGNAIFKNTALVGLDMTGNPYAAYDMCENGFDGIADTLEYLYFENSNIKNLTWTKHLYNLRVLSLSQNNINSLSLEIFSPLSRLQLLDLSSNHIGNWYNRVFTQNRNLRLLNLRDNNINIITSEMLRDFQYLDYLSLGDNNFVCDCLLRDLVDIAEFNNKEAECSLNVLQGTREKLADKASQLSTMNTSERTSFITHGYQKFVGSITNLNGTSYYDRTDDGNVGVYVERHMVRLLMECYIAKLQRSFKKIEAFHKNRPKIRVVSKIFRATNFLKSQCRNSTSEPDPLDFVLIHDKLNSSFLKFQLLDYEDDHYWCFNETERLNFTQLNCQSRIYVDDITRKLHNLTVNVVASVCSVIGLSLIGTFLYMKRWHLHYYFSYFKTAALVSVAAKNASDQLNALAASDPNLVYDIFISYCQNDRQWVIEELLPNVEESGDVSICMHERDFQIGLTILDNIVSCMDRSRALMLIISNNFLLSHWCQFEMHVAQHRIFEVSKEHLILVFLEDIPRNKRPKTLQYLMEVKTYIKWPNTGKNAERSPTADERKFFWKRLNRTLENIGLSSAINSRESHA